MCLIFKGCHIAAGDPILAAQQFVHDTETGEGTKPSQRESRIVSLRSQVGLVVVVLAESPDQGGSRPGVQCAYVHRIGFDLGDIRNGDPVFSGEARTVCRIDIVYGAYIFYLSIHLGQDHVVLQGLVRHSYDNTVAN